MGKGSLDARLRKAREVAHAQNGLVTLAQLERFGIEHRSAVGRLVSRGRLAQVLRGVYRLGDKTEILYQRLVAPCLWREDVVVSHRAAAWQHGLDLGEEQPRADSPPLGDPPRVEVVGPANVRGTPWLRVRCGPPFAPEDVARRGVVRLTSPMRTLVDLAADLAVEALGCAFESAWNRKLTTPERMARYLRQMERRVGRPPDGSRKLARWVDEAMHRGQPLESALEVRFWRALQESGLPLPIVQRPFHDEEGHPYRIDFAYERQRLAIETRGYRDHGKSHGAFDRYARRTARMVASGWAVLPVTWWMLAPEERARTMALIRRALDSRRHTREKGPLIHDLLVIPD